MAADRQAKVAAGKQAIGVCEEAGNGDRAGAEANDDCKLHFGAYSYLDLPPSTV